MTPKAPPSIRSEIRRQQLAAKAGWATPSENQEIRARLDEIEKRVARHGGLLQSIAKMIVAAGLYRKYVQTHGRLT